MKGLDPRTKSYILLLSNFILMLHLKHTTAMIFIILLIILFIYSKCYKLAIKLLIVYLITLYLTTLDKLPFISYFALVINMALPCIYAGILLTKTTKPATMIASFKKMNVSEKIIIPITVLMRYFPTLKQELIAINNGLILRGYGSLTQKIKHPIQTLEYYTIPLLMSASLTLQDLTVSAISKGIENKGKHTSLIVIKMNFIDYLVMFIGTIIIFYQLLGLDNLI